MRIAVLVTNTDESEFAQAWPKDGEKFPEMIRQVRPDWEFVVYSVKDGDFPLSLDGIDGVLITGSPASVNSGAEWVARLERLIRELVAAEVPVFGACFGHQVVAKALGGKVERNPGGWVFGQVEATLRDGRKWQVYASHSEQVTRLPEGAEVVAEGPGCAVAGFVIGDHVLTTQYHPEMAPEFVAALIDELEGELGPEISAQARASLTDAPDIAAWAEAVAEFIEAKHAHDVRS
ncbi:type 1 glutamine amidotransferase [Aquicoccus sp. G2-2]|uniref:type 1 glutamine amidotransferase n=1 Tax=Aquicoccus sp. G2-2 TaxID=3092120 RepID=UPI002ADF0B18|nr:type 1 glutamine amidotransferase [Aquicoccus sp. G2-2]MEA1113531.1 type 1 glutamine amidotransferase [Aquicoccus sp. G2-2]